MKGRNFSVSTQRVKCVVVDFIMTSLGFLLFDIFRYYSVDVLTTGFESLRTFLFNPKMICEQTLVPLSIMAIYWLSGYYNRPFDKSRLTELTLTATSILAATILIFFILLINDTTGIKIRDYETIFILFGLLFVPTYIGRYILTSFTLSQLKHKNWIYTTLIVGNSPKSREVYHKLKRSGSVWTYDVAGFIRLPDENQIEDEHTSWDWNEVERVCAEKDIDQIILVSERRTDNRIMEILNRLFPLDIPVKIAPDTLSYITGNIKLDNIIGIPFIDLTSPRMSEFQKNVKRLFDVTASIATLIVLSPVYAITALTVKLTSPGPIIYSQERIGKSRKPFRIYKFRSMAENAEANGPQLSKESDSRITPFGHFMRKYRIDELPQFWNVLKGDMSIVGPRPEREFYIQKIVRHAPYYGLIFQVRPGITSWGMVKYGYASSIPEMVERSRYDLLYLNNMSISADIKIMIYTVRTVLTGAGV